MIKKCVHVTVNKNWNGTVTCTEELILTFAYVFVSAFRERSYVVFIFSEQTNFFYKKKVKILLEQRNPFIRMKENGPVCTVSYN